MSTRVIARRYTLDVPEPTAPGCTVWRGRDTATGAAVVVTLLDAHPEADAVLAALAAVRHPALPVVLDHGVDGETRFAVTPARAGQTARARWTQRARPTPAEAAGFAADLADALAALHARGLVQGRLGLDAITLDETGPPRLEDLATAALARPADQPDDDLRRLGELLRELLGLAPDADPLAADGMPPRLAGLLQSLASFTPPPAAAVRDALRGIARADAASGWEPFPAASAAPMPPVAASAPRARNRWLVVLVAGLAVVVLVLAAVVVAGVVDRRDRDRQAAATALPGPVTTFEPTATVEGGTETGADATTAAAPAGPSRTARPLRIAAITALDPAGDQAENDAQVRFATDRSPTTGWSTEIYRRGVIEKKRGVGLELELAVPSRVRRIAITSAPVGATVVVYGARGAAPARAPRDWPELAPARTLDRRTSAIPIRHVGSLTRILVWIVGLPAVKAGYAVRVDELRVIGVPRGA
ncbi:MAG: hypothetical protein ACR2JV_05305 [Gaiellales bacterium]